MVGGGEPTNGALIGGGVGGGVGGLIMEQTRKNNKDETS
jgi:hypothetical protein